MTTKLLAICVAVAGLGSFAVSEASAREVTPVRTPASLPAVVHVNQIEVNLNAGHSRRHRVKHRRYRRVKHVTFRHGRRYTTYY